MPAHHARYGLRTHQAVKSRHLHPQALVGAPCATGRLRAKRCSSRRGGWLAPRRSGWRATTGATVYARDACRRARARASDGATALTRNRTGNPREEIHRPRGILPACARSSAADEPDRSSLGVAAVARKV